MQGWFMSRCTSACLLILALSAILFPQLRQLYLTGPPASLLFDISPSKTLFRSRIMKLLYLWYKGQKMCCMAKPLDQKYKYLKKNDSLLMWIYFTATWTQTLQYFLLYSVKMPSIYSKKIWLRLIGGPWRHHLLTMVPTIVCGEGIPGLEALVADDAVVGHVHVHFNMPPHLRLVLQVLGTCETLILDWAATITSTKQGVQHGVQI